MLFISQGKTNSKFVAIMFILAVIFTGGVYYLGQQRIVLEEEIVQEFITYTKNDQKFFVEKKEFKILIDGYPDDFNTFDVSFLAREAQDCCKEYEYLFNTHYYDEERDTDYYEKKIQDYCLIDKDIKYFEELLSNFSEEDIGIEYSFYLTEEQASQREPGTLICPWTIIVIPNKIGYTNMEDFEADFDLCVYTGGIRYPYLMSENYLLFSPSCGGAAQTTCEEIRDLIKPTIKLK